MCNADQLDQWIQLLQELPALLLSQDLHGNLADPEVQLLQSFL